MGGLLVSDVPLRDHPAVTEGTVERLPEAAVAAFGREHPGAQLERRLVPDVLAMSASELGDPVARLVLPETCHLALHQSARSSATRRAVSSGVSQGESASRSAAL